MNIKKMFILSLILLFILVPVSLAAEGDYTIPSVKKDVTVNDDGSTEIIEEIVYDIEGRVNGTYRDVVLSTNQSIEDVSVETPGYYNDLEVVPGYGGARLKVWLYNDPEKTQKTKDAKVTVKYKYTINKGVRIYNDIAEVQYMTWDNKWDTKVDSLESRIHIPGSNEATEYWNNPDDNVVSSEWTSDDTLTTKVNNIGAHKSFEQRIIMPRSYFKSTKNARVYDMDGKEKIEADQKKYQDEKEEEKRINTIFWSAIAILFAIPAGLYVYFGREPKIRYHAEYEFDFPSSETPLEVNALMQNEIGTVNTDAVSTTILDLMNRKYYKVMQNDDTKTIIRQTDKDTSELKDYEKLLMNFLASFAENGDISIGAVGRRTNRNHFMKFWKEWKKLAEKEIPESLLNKYFDYKGSKILSKFGYFLIALFGACIVMIIILLVFTIKVSFVGIVLFLMPVFMIEGIILVAIPNHVAGRWTPEGREVHDKWRNFEKYLKDYSMIAERPPASVQIWGKYLVYATALGCADEVSKNMRQYFNSLGNYGEDLDTSSIVAFSYHGGLSHVNTSLTTLSIAESGHDSGGIGSSGGGGFGGGGGGTF